MVRSWSGICDLLINQSIDLLIEAWLNESSWCSTSTSSWSSSIPMKMWFQFLTWPLHWICTKSLTRPMLPHVERLALGFRHILINQPLDLSVLARLEEFYFFSGIWQNGASFYSKYECYFCSFCWGGYFVKFIQMSANISTFSTSIKCWQMFNCTNDCGKFLTEGR